jgi:hypothetical protein
MARRTFGVWAFGGVLSLAACSSNMSASLDDSSPAPTGSIGAGASSGSSGSGNASGTAGTTAILGSGGSGEGAASGGSSSSAGSAGSAGSSSSPPLPPSSESGEGNPVPGTLTAGAWDDNLNYGFFDAYRRRMQANLQQVELSGLLPFDDEEYESARAEFTRTPAGKDTLDVALVVDTTGSMGDEMQYLKIEFRNIAATISASHPNAEQRWSLVVYRDEGDTYVVQAFDFDSELQTFQENLGAQAAGGGGDFPEAPDQALSALTELDWRSDPATARLAFWVADAPNHPERVENMATAIRDVGSLGIHVYPVASSGIDEITELTMRTTAELTGGRYLFLTDDSGVGGAHKEPTIPCYFVTQLDRAIVRMVDIELSGVYREPSAEEILRTGGNPTSGACTLGSGDTVLVF